MPQFSPIRVPFDAIGVDLVHPPDRQPQGKFPFLSNARSVQEGTLTSRPGYGPQVNASTFDQTNVHSVRRMNNYLPGATPTLRRFCGAGTKLYSADAGVIDTGYSGDPLSLVLWRPDQSVEPWMYVGDKNKMRKCRMNASQTNYQVGITPPTAAPSITLSQPKYTIVNEFDATAGWAHSGTSGAPTLIPRDRDASHLANFTTINYILYDTGTSGWANISPINSYTGYWWIGVGARFTLNSGGGNAEIVTVQEVHTQVSNSTILGIKYDTGSTGLCTIQAATPLVGLTLNSLVLLNSGGGTAEVVRIVSANMGPDGLYSFRCVTVNNHAASETITGLPAFRAYLTNTHATTEQITGTGLTFGTTAGIGTLYKNLNLDLSQASGQPLSSQDYLHISVWIDNPANLIEGRLLLNVSASDLTFDADYYYFPFRPADNSAALAGTQTSLQSLQTAAQNLLIGEVQAAIPAPSFVNATDPHLGISTPDILVPGSQQLFTGSATWTEIQIPYSALQRVGADGTRSIANVNAIGIWINAQATVNCEVSAWWVGGGYGPDTSNPTAQPLLYRYRYRSTLTGAKSQQSPATRSTLVTAPDGSIVGMSSGLLAYRQQTTISPSLSADPQADQIDIERFGGVLNEWHFVGTTPNTGTPVFLDDYSDDQIKTNPALETDAVLPFPSFDVPKTGTVNVVGTQVTLASGDQFSTNWAPGQEILINGIPYITYGQPGSATSLATVENVGVLTGVPFLVAEPTLIGQPLPHIIGPFEQGNFLIGWGDPRNPGTIYATKGNDPDSAPIPYYLELCDPSEPIVGGVVWDNNAIVASTKRFWRISIDANAVETGHGNVLVKQELQVGRGLFAPWAICAGPLIWFLDEAGVPCETNGGPAVSIVEEDLRPLFPYDGEPGVATNGYSPPDLTVTTGLRMAYANGKMRFMFQDTAGAQVNWDYDPIRKGWRFNTYTIAMDLAYWEEGESLDSELLCGQDGNIYQVGGFSDNGVAIRVSIQAPFQANSRTEKFFGDAWVDADTQGVTNVEILQTFDLGVVTNSGYFLTGTGRTQYPLNTSNSNGQLARNAGLTVTWASATAAPVLYEWQPWLYDTGTVLRTSWASLPTSHGLEGWQHMREGYLPFLMPTAGTVNLIITIDGVAQPPYPFTPTANRLQKLLVDFLPAKGLMYEWQLQSATPFLIFLKDLEIRAKSWGSSGPYQNVRPFGDD